MLRAAAILVGAVLAATPLRAHPGVGVVVADDGSVFYTDLANVYRIDPGGRKSIAVPGVHTHELFLDASGTLFGEHLWYEGEATDRWGHYVWKRTPDGSVSKVIPATEGFRKDYSFVRDRAGNMYWASSPTSTSENDVRTVVRKRSPDGRITILATGFDHIRWMSAAPDGTVILTDGDRLRRVEPDGTVATLASRLKRRRLFSDHDLMGLCAAPDGTVYLARMESREVLKVEPDGSVSAFARSSAPWSPTGVAVTGGSVFVLESAFRNARVRRLGVDGKERGWPEARTGSRE